MLRLHAHLACHVDGRNFNLVFVYNKSISQILLQRLVSHGFNEFSKFALFFRKVATIFFRRFICADRQKKTD